MSSSEQALPVLLALFNMPGLSSTVQKREKKENRIVFSLNCSKEALPVCEAQVFV
jgi:hypothetical protein